MNTMFTEILSDQHKLAHKYEAEMIHRFLIYFLKQ